MEVSYAKTDKLMFDFTRDEGGDDITTIVSIIDKLVDESRRAGFKRTFDPNEIQMINNLKRASDQVLARQQIQKRAIEQP